ncbi:MAG: hypothetical protein QM676_08340 [Novosphingobium sp.]
MKANRHTQFAALISAAALGALVASCASPPPPAPPPRPRPQPSHTPLPPPPPPQAQPQVGWRDAPITPGNWRWSRIGGASAARFAEGPSGALLEFRCDRATNSVLLIRAGTASGRVTMTVTTTAVARPLTAQPLGGPQPALVVSIPARDALLDAVIFSRGRFAVEAQGLAPIYAPTWPEIARVVEDCR